MILDIPDHYAPNIGAAFVLFGAERIRESKCVPAFIHQYADIWEALFPDQTMSYWDFLVHCHSDLKELVDNR